MRLVPLPSPDQSRLAFPLPRPSTGRHLADFPVKHHGPMMADELGRWGGGEAIAEVKHPRRRSARKKSVTGRRDERKCNVCFTLRHVFFTARVPSVPEDRFLRPPGSFIAPIRLSQVAWSVICKRSSGSDICGPLQGIRARAMTARGTRVSENVNYSVHNGTCGLPCRAKTHDRRRAAPARFPPE